MTETVIFSIAIVVVIFIINTMLNLLTRSRSVVEALNNRITILKEKVEKLKNTVRSSELENAELVRELVRANDIMILVMILMRSHNEDVPLSIYYNKEEYTFMLFESSTLEEPFVHVVDKSVVKEVQEKLSIYIRPSSTKWNAYVSKKPFELK